MSDPTLLTEPDQLPPQYVPPRRRRSRGKQAAVIIIALLVVVGAAVATLQNIGVIDLFGGMDGSRLSGNFRLVKSTGDSDTADGTNAAKNTIVEMTISDVQAASITVNGYPEGHSLKVTGTAKKDTIKGNNVVYSIKDPHFSLDGEDAAEKLSSLAAVGGLSDLAASLVSVKVTTPLRASEGKFVGTWSLSIAVTAAYSIEVTSTVTNDATFTASTAMHYPGEDASATTSGTWKKTSTGEFDLTTEKSASYHASVAY